MNIRRPRRLNRRNLILIASIGLIVIVCLIVAVMIYQRNTAMNDSSDQSTVKPSYTTILPAGKSIAKLGGWQRVSPAGSDPVYAYIDSINEIAISVSEQVLPPSFKGDTDNQIAALAKGYDANDKIDAKGTAAYIGTSTKGPQSVIFTKDNLLLLIKSEEKIDDNAWAGYISQLK